VSADPNPEDAVCHVDTERTVSQPNTNRPLFSNLLEAERWVARIVLQNLVVAASKYLDFRGKDFERFPELR
jgi:hypothetical protein